MACRSQWSSSARPIISTLRTQRRPCLSRLLSATTKQLADEPASSSSSEPNPPVPTSTPTSTPSTGTPTLQLSSDTRKAVSSRKEAMDILTGMNSSLGGGRASASNAYGLERTSLIDKWAPMGRQLRRYGDDEYHLHVFATKHNTHLTLCGEDRKSIISISTGNLGFRKGQRGSFDAGYQLMAYMLSRIQQQGLMTKINKLELCLRGVGQGRDAVTKVLLGAEGTRLRDAVVRIVDKTRLKIGGGRSPAKRRLG